MPDVAVHSRQAKHNEAFLTEFNLAQTTYSDWAVTVMFYTALHLIEAYLATQGLHPTDHWVRENYLTRITALKPIYRPYRELRHYSEKARYRGARLTTDAITTLSDGLKTIEEHLQEVSQGS